MRGQEYGVRHYVVTAPTTLIDFLMDTLKGLASKDRVLELLDLGSVYVDNLRSDLNQQHSLLSVNSSVRVHLEPRRFPRPSDLTARITEQNDHYLIVDKPAGIPVHALVDNKKENLITYLETDLSRKLFVTHRLDVDTTGLVIFAKTPESQSELNSKFKSGSVKRAYLALTEIEVALGTYVHFMEPSPKAPKKVSSLESKDWLRCELRVVAIRPATTTEHRVQTTLSKSWLLKNTPPSEGFELEIELVTGRTHQIRAQLAALGAPILGDHLYGSGFHLSDVSTGAAAIALWAFKIQTTPDEKILRPS